MLTILDEINKLLSYLNINTKYLNKAYTLLSLIPMIWIAKILFSMDKSSIMNPFWGYLLALIVLFYFFILNFLYYFFGKNTKFDITQLMAQKLPDEMFTSDNVSSNPKSLSKNENIVKINYVPNYENILSKNIDYLIKTNKIKTQELINNNYLVPLNTLYPYYIVSRDLKRNCYVIKIGTDFNNMSEIGTIDNTNEITTLGLFIVGGPYMRNNVKYNRMWKLKLIIKDKN